MMDRKGWISAPQYVIISWFFKTSPCLWFHRFTPASKPPFLQANRSWTSVSILVANQTLPNAQLSSNLYSLPFSACLRQETCCHFCIRNPIIALCRWLKLLCFARKRHYGLWGGLFLIWSVPWGRCREWSYLYPRDGMPWLRRGRYCLKSGRLWWIDFSLTADMITHCLLG